MKKSDRIKELEEKNKELEQDIEFLEDRIMALNKQIRSSEHNEVLKSKKTGPKYAGDIAFDYWPLEDWFRFSVKKWNPGRYFQVCVGPIRIEFFEN